MPDPLAVQCQGNGQSQHCDIHSGLGAECVDVASLDPSVDSVQESKSHDILYGRVLSVSDPPRRGLRVKYLESIDEQKCIGIDRQIAVADISHRCDWDESQAYGDHAVAEESALGCQHSNLTVDFKVSIVTHSEVQCKPIPPPYPKAKHPAGTIIAGINSRCNLDSGWKTPWCRLLLRSEYRSTSQPPAHEPMMFPSKPGMLIRPTMAGLKL
jgi:hypothetical protein